MPNKRRMDKAFHLTVTLFAITLTTASLFALAYQQSPDVVRRWLHPLQRLAWPNHVGTTTRRATGPSAAVPQNGGTTTNRTTGVSQSQPEPSSANTNLVSVVEYGTDVPQTTLSHTRDLMKQLRIVDTVAGTLHLNLGDSVKIYLAQTADDYKRALNHLGVSLDQAKQLSQDTGGFTQGNSVIIPVYHNTNDGDMANTLAHELTHVFLDSNVENVPSWVNEGLAVTMGMNAEQKVDSPVSYEGDAKTQIEDVLAASSNGHLQPLTDDENQVLSGDAPYNLEIQDWLAVRDLMSTYGFRKFGDYFHRLNLGESANAAFSRTFGLSETKFNAKMTNLFQTAAKSKDTGVELTFSVPSDFRGYIRMLQHGTQYWTGIKTTPGNNPVTLLPNGQISNGDGLSPIKDSSPADAHTLYVNLDPDTKFKVQGQTVMDCGFAVDYHDGLYAFMNAWYTLNSGKTVYVDDPALFGVKLTQVQEMEQNVLTPLYGGQLGG